MELLRAEKVAELETAALAGAVPSVGTIAVTASREEVAVAVEPREAAIRVA
jgi:hypothetical protein